MKRSSRLLLTAWISLLLPASAENKLGGRYVGDWNSESLGVGGAFRLTISQAADPKWNCEVTFTLGGEDEVRTAVKFVRVERSKLEVRYEFDLQGNRLQSTITGELLEKRLEGKYQTVRVADGAPVDQGRWKAALSE